MVDDGAVTGSRTVGAPGKGELLKQVIVDRIRSGAYPVGHRLGSVRKAAVQFQVHPNTLSRVYRELAEDGILRTAHGSGTYVLAVPGSEYGDSGITQLATALVDLAEQARRLGVSREAWEDMVVSSTEAAFCEATVKVWMVECSKKDVQELSYSLTRLLDREVSPLLVEEVPSVLDESGRDVFLTTPFHYDELAAMIEDERALLSVNVVPTPETLVSFAAIEAEERVSVLALNQPTLDRMVQMVRTFARVFPVAAELITSDTAEKVAKDAAIIVDSQSIDQEVRSWNPNARIITVRYQIEPTSVAYVRAVLQAQSARGASQAQVGS